MKADYIKEGKLPSVNMDLRQRRKMELDMVRRQRKSKKLEQQDKIARLYALAEKTYMSRSGWTNER